MKYVHRENFNHLIGSVGFDAAGLLENVLSDHVAPKAPGFVEGYIQSRAGRFTHVKGVKLAIDLAGGQAYLEENSSGWEVRVHYELDGVKHMVVAPLDAVLRGAPSLDGLYQCYVHTVAPMKSDVLLNSYAGITKQGWSRRWAQHLRAAENGSPYTFHKHLRENLTKPGMCVVHNIRAVGMTYEEAMDLEEIIVSHTLRPKGLNMIPGGYAGLRYLHMLGALNRDRHSSEVENRAELMARFMRDNTALQALWADPSWAASVICGHSGRLTLDQVRAVRELASRGHQAEQILELVDARNIAQVRRLLRGDTYSRVA